MTAKTLLDGLSAQFSYDMNLALGRLAAANVRSVSLCNEDSANLQTIATNAASTTPSPVIGPGEWETVAASATNQALGPTGAVGDFLSHLLIIPATLSPGAVTIKDGAGGAITVFTGGASSVTSLIPFVIPLGMKSLAGAWQVTTGANVSAIGVGDFT